MNAFISPLILRCFFVRIRPNLLLLLSPTSAAVLILTDVCIWSPLESASVSIALFSLFRHLRCLFFDLAILRWISACEVQGEREKARRRGQRAHVNPDAPETQERRKSAW